MLLNVQTQESLKVIWTQVISIPLESCDIIFEAFDKVMDQPNIINKNSLRTSIENCICHEVIKQSGNSFKSSEQE
jgi:hypothetical protein